MYPLKFFILEMKVYPLFSGREGWHYVLIFGLSSVLSGREGWHYVLIFGLSSVLSGREDSKNELSSVSGREG